jgi:DNA mismatch repair ATPase MutS
MAAMPIPMCGVPVACREGYLARLIKAGHRVAIAEQTESPASAQEARRLQGAGRARDHPRRHAGTLTEEALLDAAAPIGASRSARRRRRGHRRRRHLDRPLRADRDRCRRSAPSSRG